MEEGPAEDGPFFAHQAGGGAGHRDALGRDHLAGDAAAGVGGHHQVGVHPDLLRRGLLQGGEQGVGGGVRPGEEDAHPTQEGREEREGRTRGGKGQTQGGAHAGVVHDEGQAQDQGDGEDGEAQQVEGPAQAGKGLAKAVLGHNQDRQEAGDEDGGAGRGADIDVIDRGVGRILGHDGGGLDHQVVEQRPLETGAERLEKTFDGFQAPQEDHDGQDDVRGPGPDHFAGGKLTGHRSGGFFIGKMKDRLGFPEVQENPQADDGDDGGNDVRQIRADEVGDHELGDGKAETGDNNGGQNFHGPLPAAHGHRQPQGHDQGKKGQLAAHDLADVHHVQAGDAGGHHDGDADGAEGHGGGVGDEADAGGVAGVEPQAHQHGRGDGHRGAEPGGAFDEGPEGKGDEQGLEAAVIGDAGQGVLDDLEVAALHRHVVDPDGGDHDPDDGEDAEGRPIQRRGNGVAHRHAPDDDGQQYCGQGGEERRIVPLGRRIPSMYSRMNSGMAATRAERPRFPKGL